MLIHALALSHHLRLQTHARTHMPLYVLFSRQVSFSVSERVRGAPLIIENLHCATSALERKISDEICKCQLWKKNFAAASAASSARFGLGRAGATDCFGAHVHSDHAVALSHHLRLQKHARTNMPLFVLFSRQISLFVCFRTCPGSAAVRRKFALVPSSAL